MDVPGWTFYGLNMGAWLVHSIELNQSFYNCSDARWFGYCVGSCTGSVKTKFNKCGRAHLHIGNCYNNSNVTPQFTEAKLNGQKILTVNALENKAIEFDFKDGDIFELADIAQGVIDLYDIKVISCSLC